MVHRCVPLTTGSPRSISIDVGPFKVTEAWFPAELVLPPHLHDRTTFAVILAGSFDLNFGSRIYECPASTVFTEPLGEMHGNRMGSRGAHVLVIQPDHGQSGTFDPCRSIFDRVTHFADSNIPGLAWRLAYELREPDSASRLAAQGLGFEMLALATRLKTHNRTAAPVWLGRAVELIRSQFLKDIDTELIAAAAGVHPSHLTRVFRRHYHESIGSFVRRLRLDWAAGELAGSTKTIVEIALEAGFADQSHFTRSFKRHNGVGPGAYRRIVRS